VSLEFGCNSRVDALSFGLVCDNKGVDESGKGEKKRENGEDGICGKEDE
jgi:hypothetical protein